MRNREVRAFAALLLAAALVTEGLSTETLYAQAKDAAETSTAQAKNEGRSAGEAAAPRKDETVYVKLDESGAKKEVIVSDQLKNIKDIQSIHDVSDLTDIENVKGDETFSAENGKLTWNGAGQDIVYQGKTTKELPVDVKITYSLDGKTVTADELKGSSGHLIIRYDYENKTGRNGSYVPFAMVTGIVLKEGEFSNVQVENGKVISDGERDIVIGMGIPGLSKELDVSAVNIPEYFQMEADVEDFGSVTSMTVASNDILHQLDTQKLDEGDDMRADLDKLSSSSRQLVDGSKELKDGTARLLDGTGTLTDGINALTDGGRALVDGADSLHKGTLQLADGGKTLADGAKQLSDGIAQVDGAAGALSDGTGRSKAGAQQLYAGAAALSDGIGQLQNSAGAGVDKMVKGAHALQDGVAQAKQGADRLGEGIRQAGAGASALQENIGKVKAAVDQSKQLADGLSAQLASGSMEMDVPVTQSDYPVSLDVELDNTQIREQVEAALRSAGASDEEIAAALQAIAPKQTRHVEGTTDVSLNKHVTIPFSNTKLAQGLGGLSALSDGASKGLSELSVGAGQLAGSISSDKGLSGGANQLSAALAKDGALSSGLSSLEGGLTQMGQQVAQGAGQLKDGADRLTAGSGELVNGLGQLDAGAGQLKDGTGRLAAASVQAGAGAGALLNGVYEVSDGADALHTGAASLYDGLVQMKDGSAPLVDGIRQLDEGAGTLADGMAQFDEEGIQKLVSTVENDLLGMTDKLQTILDHSKSYNNFSGIADGMDGEVKFVFVSGE